MFIITAIIGSVIGAAFNSGGDDLTPVDVLVSIAGNVLTGPLMAVTAGVIYIDLRARQGEFDRLILSSELGPREDRPPTEPPPMIR